MVSCKTLPKSYKVFHVFHLADTILTPKHSSDEISFFASINLQNWSIGSDLLGSFDMPGTVLDVDF